MGIYGSARTIAAITGLQTTLDSLYRSKRTIEYRREAIVLSRSYPLLSDASITGTGVNSTVLVTGKTLYIPFVAIKTGIIDNVYFLITGIGASTTTSFRVAIYNNLSLYPTSLIAVGTDLTGINTTGAKNIAISASVTINNLYWLGINLANTTGTAAHSYRAGYCEPILGLSSILTGQVGYNTTGQSTTTLFTFPSSVPASQPILDIFNNNMPGFAYSYSS